MDTRNVTMTEKSVKEATAIFDQLAETDRIKDRLMIVENPDLTEEEHRRVVDNICASILRRTPPMNRTNRK